MITYKPLKVGDSVDLACCANQKWKIMNLFYMKSNDNDGKNNLESVLQIQNPGDQTGIDIHQATIRSGVLTKDNTQTGLLF